MKIGYPCSNLRLSTRSTLPFHLADFTEERLFEIVARNLDALESILRFNVAQGLLLFRIASGLIPFGAHPVNVADWRGRFRDRFAALGDYIRAHDCRISMHPGQYIQLNSPRPDMVAVGVADLAYHADVLELFGLDARAKLQIHVGGTYGDKALALGRFVEQYDALPEAVKRRLCIENDERQYDIEDCLELNRRCGVPVLFDAFHHSLYGERALAEAVRDAAATWRWEDGIPLVDYSTQAPGKQIGAHTDFLDEELFRGFLEATRGSDFDLMLEIKNKEDAAIPALAIARAMGRAD